MPFCICQKSANYSRVSNKLLNNQLSICCTRTTYRFQMRGVTLLWWWNTSVYNGLISSVRIVQVYLLWQHCSCIFVSKIANSVHKSIRMRLVSTKFSSIQCIHAYETTFRLKWKLIKIIIDCCLPSTDRNPCSKVYRVPTSPGKSWIFLGSTP